MNTKILLIDDDKNITILLSRCLNKFGFEVITSNNSTTSSQLVQRHDPGAVILDLMMPEMDGWQVCREIRKFSRVPILIYSAMGDFHTMSSILDAGADYFLLKPASVNTLVAHIKYAILCSEGQKMPSSHLKNDSLSGSEGSLPQSQETLTCTATNAVRRKCRSQSTLPQRDTGIFETSSNNSKGINHTAMEHTPEPFLII